MNASDPVAMVTLTHQLTHQELSMLGAIREFMLRGTGRSPQAHEIGAVPKLRRRPRPGASAAFKRLVALGLIEHSRNGHCWLTPAAMRFLHTCSIDNSHHHEGTTP